MKTKLIPIRTLLFAALVALQPGITRAASPSELLEKGIYTEETKGDVELAITIYQQLLTDAKANQSLAAQAQFRLGQCLLKKKRDAEATAAFEKLIKDFPDEKELVAKAQAYLPTALALGPVPWVDGERQQLTLTLATGLDIGAMELRADLVDVNGRKAWRVGRRMHGGGEMLSSVDVDPETFQPFTSYWKHTLLGEATATYKPGEVEIKSTGSADPVTSRPDKTVYDNEEFMHMIRRLPLAVGYKTTIPTLSSLGGGVTIPVALEVTKKETLDTTAGKFDCFKMPLNIGQTFWISDDEHRYVVKFEGGGATGTLASVTTRKAGTPISFRDDALGVSITAPADWVIHRRVSERRKGGSTIYFLDAGADADGCELNLAAAESLSASVRQSARAWADEDLRDNQAKELQDFKIRADGWRSYNVAGRAGVGCTADFVDKGKAKVFFAIYAVGPKTCEKFVAACGAAQADALKSAFEGIVASYRMTK